MGKDIGRIVAIGSAMWISGSLLLEMTALVVIWLSRCVFDLLLDEALMVHRVGWKRMNSWLGHIFALRQRRLLPRSCGRRSDPTHGERFELRGCDENMRSGDRFRTRLTEGPEHSASP